MNLTGKTSMIEGMKALAGDDIIHRIKIYPTTFDGILNSKFFSD